MVPFSHISKKLLPCRVSTFNGREADVVLIEFEIIKFGGWAYPLSKSD